MYFAIDMKLAAAFLRAPGAGPGPGAGALEEAADVRDFRAAQVPVRARISDVGGVPVAVIDVRGVMGFEPDLVEQVFYGSVSTQAIAAEIDRVAGDPALGRAIALNIHSPGGDALGMSGMADSIVRARAKKPVVAFVNRMAASAAYYQASQADKVIVAPDGMVGSIGVIATMVDLSKMFEERGIRFVHVHHGENKAVGAFGAPVTRRDEEVVLEETRPLYEQFIAAVARGRSMTPEQARTLATGAVWIGADAVKVGLADAVGELGVALGTAAALATNRGRGNDNGRNGGSATGRAPSATTRTGARPNNKGASMKLSEFKAQEPEAYAELLAEARANAPAAEPAATLGELDAEFKGDEHSAFKIGQLRAGSTMSEARARFAEAQTAATIAGLRAQVDTLTKERDSIRAEKAKAETTLAAIAKTGVKAGTVPESKDSTGGAGAETQAEDQNRAGMKFRGVLKAKAAELGKPVNHHEVILAAKKADPTAYAEWETACRADPTLRV